MTSPPTTSMTESATWTDVRIGATVTGVRRPGGTGPVTLNLEGGGEIEVDDVLSWRNAVTLYRVRTRHGCCDLRFGRMGWLRQDRGLCLFACST
jgi:hypothetical protein